MLFSNPRVLPALLLCLGLSLLYVRGKEMKTLQAWNPQDIETAVELNYALDMARREQTAPASDTEKQARKAGIRKEIEATFVEPQQRIRREYTQAKWMSGAGLVLMLIVLGLQKRGIIKK